MECEEVNQRDLEKAFNTLHTNSGRRDDFPPERCLKEGIRNGPHAGFALSEEGWGTMFDEYYELHHWDPETGLQAPKCLKDLDLVGVADDLERVGKLGKV